MTSERVLFVCGENAARSQMAEAFFNHAATRVATVAGPVIRQHPFLSAVSAPSTLTAASF